MAGIVETEVLLDGLKTGTIVESANDHTHGVFEYLQMARSDPRLATRIVPIGGGIAVSRRRHRDEQDSPV